MIRRFLSCCALLLLVSCAYATEQHIQDIEVITPGAHDAICYVYVEGLRYKVRPPQTVNISKSQEDLIVDCLAPGNRRKKVVIQPDISARAVIGNTPTGVVPGASWDYLSGAMFKYPSVITIDFTNARTTPEALPAQNNPDIKQPEEYFLEEFKPGQPVLNDDRYNVETKIRRRQSPYQDNPGYTESFVSEGEGTGKGDLVPMQVPAGMDPSGEASPVYTPPSYSGPSYGPGAETTPTPLYPGQ